MKLKKVPLAEVIFEVRWQLTEVQQKVYVDQDYKLLPGVLLEKVKKIYPFHESLPAVDVPDEITPYIIKHRFRTAKEGFPILQIGPGIFTVNDTEKYSWVDFKKRISEGLKVLHEAHPNATNFVIKELTLRFVNSFEFDFNNTDVLEFLKENLGVEVALKDGLFKSNVEPVPKGVNLIFSFPTNNPNGTFNLIIARGKKKEVESLLWEMNIKSEVNSHLKPKEIEVWATASQKIIHDWFFKMMEPKLMKGLS